MLLRPRRPPPPGPPASLGQDSPDELEDEEEEEAAAEDSPGTPPRRPASPGPPEAHELPGSPVSPGSAQRTPWSARETELLLGTLLQPAVWRALLLDRRRALPTYRRVSAALARQQVRRTPAQCRRRYKFLKDKLREAQDQPPGPFDAQIRQLMGLLGDTGSKRGRRRSPGPGRPPRGRRPAPSAPAGAPAAEPDAPSMPAARDSDVDPSWTLRFSSSPAKAPEALPREPGSPTALPPLTPAPGRSEERAPLHAPSSPPPLDPAWERPDSPPGRPESHAPPPQAAAPSLNAALMQTLGHLGDIVAVLGPLRDQLLTLNQHVEQLRGSFDQTVSLAVGFILGSAAAERGVLGDPRP
ncbi:undifferentiated embryonic cell transcription factor 1 [Pipistrellus kuhlii]|uniref:Undifferentiated embryonic cell transcription factor 1 n=1 Tax=Pipistrellus kuhlii TaxID=59472 RepID=A0A7J7VCU2_PIPKU|nr:undifferentiated embryonic cell transcription factor 1 [Pipistrellus kuhlii]KAF6323007.1 undifferentiated embryonic cell transcription factor 1 [Pipistrellus kuhlii]